jgi:hypothetical protein
MRKLQEVTPRLERPLPSGRETTAIPLPGFIGLHNTQGADFSIAKAQGWPGKEEKPEPETGNPKKGVKWEDMTREEREEAWNIQFELHKKPESALPPKVTSIAKDVVEPSNPGKPFTGLDWAKMIGTMKKRSPDVDVEAENATGLELPVRKVRKPALPAAIKRAAESVANSHYDKFPVADMDIKEAHGSALAYFKKTFTENGTNEEVEQHIKSSYPHLIPKEMQTPRADTPFAARVAPRTAKSGAAVAKFAANPLSAFSPRPKSTKADRNAAFRGEA